MGLLKIRDQLRKSLSGGGELVQFLIDDLGATPEQAIEQVAEIIDAELEWGSGPLAVLAEKYDGHLVKRALTLAYKRLIALGEVSA